MPNIGFTSIHPSGCQVQYMNKGCYENKTDFDIFIIVIKDRNRYVTHIQVIETLEMYLYESQEDETAWYESITDICWP